MGEEYNYRAPQYVDFSSVVHDDGDNDFFDFDMDTGAPVTMKFTPNASLENEPATPYEDAEDDDDASSSASVESPKSRRHTSYKRQTLPRRSIFDGIELEAAPEKSHSMRTRLDSVTRTPRLELRSRSIVKVANDSLGAPSPILEDQSLQDTSSPPPAEVHHSSNEEGHAIAEKKAGKRPVPAPRKRKLSETTHGAYDEPPAKFVSMAEHIIKLQKQTPARFHTKPRFDGVTKKTFGGPTAPKSITVPHTPALVSHLRTRPVHALTREEEELKEFEEAQKNKFKAMPIKENIKTARVAVVEKKPPTQVQPFHLTEYKPKPRVPDEAPMVFKARPVPKSVRSGPKVEVPKKRKIPTPPPPQKPAPKSNPGPQRSRTTVVKPFSFESRGFDPKAKREKLIKEMEEQERKAKEFKARPLPPVVKAVVESLPKRSKPNDNVSLPTEKFKARSPVVLRKAPFVPAKPARAPLEPKPFNLHSEARLQERHKYDLILKQKELELEAQRRYQEEEEARRTAEEIAQLRRKTVHHAKPVPQYRAFEVKPSFAPLTNPHSPHFMKRLRSQKAATEEKLNTTFDIENP